MDIEEKTSPVYHIKAVPVEKVCANNYNPNVVAPEMIIGTVHLGRWVLLCLIVCYYDKENDKYHCRWFSHRYQVLKTSDIYEREKGILRW